uniref:Cytochrome c oxidase subunit 3 n=1 Tax=Xylocopa appendiculata TaxID=135683 RepID=A0A343DRE5_9HYME|nr:cytochrome c oxidase subunit 3 [Xylocopa appendiculata]
MNMKTYNHPYHMVTLSPWPIMLSFNLMNMLMSVVIYMYLNIYTLLLMNFLIMILSMFQWWRDIIRESTFQGFHTLTVTKFLKFSMILFIISELFFFISFFWTFFHSSISPTIEIGLTWPPMMINSFNPYDIPLLNSVILVSSGFTITWSHHSLLNKNYMNFNKSLTYTLMLGVYFITLQYMEYYESQFCMNDSIFGSVFFMMTGFHGLHVIIGILMISTMFLRFKMNHFSNIHHFHFEASLWYWHFVDVVWLFLYLFVYWWMW